ncbi:MAG: cryptochrome/photolyase family protein [Verrucomicrobia bacterium]|nr:cryptochrome/photolyase family protein [Verrucomicrobiota bacterium]MCH8529161.1 cryptochrome/photolyase family protein [Kiritimatiellia bacterium]
MKILNIILGDQLDPHSAIFEGEPGAEHHYWMTEVTAETTRIWSHKIRTAYFIAAMRHFREDLLRRGLPLTYRTFAETEDTPDFQSAFERDLRQINPDKLRMVPPGEYHLYQTFTALAKNHGIELEWLPDRHFLTSPKAFREYAKGRKQLRMEYFYREMRKQSGLLLDADGNPEGGKWNYDAANRSAFPKSGPENLPQGKRFPPDGITRAVLDEINTRFPNHPGDLNTFDWPVTPAQAAEALEDFIEHRLPLFGKYQDAIWTGEPFLYHARLSCALNVKLIDPVTVCKAVEKAWRANPDRIPLEAAEGFIRQLIGWREYVRGIYWMEMPGYLQKNALNATRDLPGMYWTGETDMACMRDALTQTLTFGYAHHIQRLMVTGLFSLLLGVDPRQTHEWYLAVYLDAVEWVELPNTLGMSQYADGGIMASKPYAATGKYIQRMSNACASCRYNPANRTGDDACPFTTLYWDFLDRHRDTLAANPRMSLQVRNLDRIDDTELSAIRKQARHLIQTL